MKALVTALGLVLILTGCSAGGPHVPPASKRFVCGWAFSESAPLPDCSGECTRVDLTFRRSGYDGWLRSPEREPIRLELAP